MDIKLVARPIRPNDYQPPMYTIEEAAGICVGQGPTGKGAKVALESGHDSLLEHINFTFRIDGVSRALLAQLTRHRLVSYSVESQRYVDMHCFEYITPPSIDAVPEVKKAYDQAMAHIREFYATARKHGIPGEDARYALPNATCTRLLMTANLREMKNILSLRCCNRAQWEIRDMAQRMLKIIQEELPEVTKDWGAPCKRGECKEKRPCHKTK